MTALITRTPLTADEPFSAPSLGTHHRKMMKLLSIVSFLVLLAVPASALLGSSRHPTKEDRRLARKRNTVTHDGRLRRLAMEDCPGPIPALLKVFDELTDAEIAAADKLGYSSQMWDDDDYPQKYEGVTWEELPSDAQANFVVLGIDKQVFDGYYGSIYWGKLDKIDPALVSAAETLGFTKESWNTCYYSICTAVQEGKYMHHVYLTYLYIHVLRW